MSRKIILIKQELLLLVYELNRSGLLAERSEERRVGKEMRSWWAGSPGNNMITNKTASSLHVSMPRAIFIDMLWPVLFFFKQKTAYEIGLGIPAEPLFRSLQSFIASMTQKLTLSDISDESKNYLDKAGITTACLRIKSKWTAGG